MNIILLAPPAAGKGTQASLLEKTYNLNHISTGDLLRNAANNNQELKKIMASGNLVSDDIVLNVLNDYLDNTDNMNLLLDGFPRNIYQAQKLDEILNKRNSKINYVFLINVSKDTLLDRITGRRLCKSCGAIYNVNIDTLKPKNDSICDKCGGELFLRQDDNSETFNVRYHEYQVQTEPLINYYSNQNVLFEIDGNCSIEEIFKQIEKTVSK